MTCNPDDLVLIPFPYADLSSSKKRPALFLTTSDRHGDFIALAVTSIPHPEPAIQLTSADVIDGSLPKPSWLRADKVFTLSEQSIIKRVGKIKAECVGKALNGLCGIVGFAK